MGMGEPLANYTRVIAAVRRLTDPAPEGLGPVPAAHHRLHGRVWCPAMRRLADEDLSVTLALSLHAPDDDLRDELVPVNQRWKVAEVLDAAWDYAARTGRRVSIEYAMIKDVNDQPWRADLLGRLLARPAGARQSHPAQPDAGQPVGRQPEAGRAGVRPAAARGRRPDYGTGHPGPGDRRRVRPARRCRTVAAQERGDGLVRRSCERKETQ